jgi:hypothetical protein
LCLQSTVPPRLKLAIQNDPATLKSLAHRYGLWRNAKLGGCNPNQSLREAPHSPTTPSGKLLSVRLIHPVRIAQIQFMVTGTAFAVSADRKRREKWNEQLAKPVRR